MHPRHCDRIRVRPLVVILLLAVITVGFCNPAGALITGGKGNSPINDPGWPKGAAAVFNCPGRVAWWEGPPFGGGQWYAECRGEADALNKVLADFAKQDSKSKRVILHDGIGHSFWLAPNRKPDKLQNARIDWVFMVWQPANWQRLRNLPADLNPVDPGDRTPPSQIDVYTGNIVWDDVQVPDGIEVIDQRLEAHGFRLEDGVVMEGRVTDAVTKQPVAATLRLQRVEPQEVGGYQYPDITQTKADKHGRWVLTNVPAGWLRVIAEADGFVPRTVGHARVDKQPQWKPFDAALARAAVVSGQVTDKAGDPLADAEVSFYNVQPRAGGRYDSPTGFACTTDENGRFLCSQVPIGKATVRVHKPGYVRPGLGLPITTPDTNVKLQMEKSSSLVVTVDFTNSERPESYIVNIAPEGGEAVGSYGGSGNINDANQTTFNHVPPGRYALHGHPNPSSADEKSKPILIELKGGEAHTLTLQPK